MNVRSNRTRCKRDPVYFHLGCSAGERTTTPVTGTNFTPMQTDLVTYKNPTEYTGSVMNQSCANETQPVLILHLHIVLDMHVKSFHIAIALALNKKSCVRKKKKGKWKSMSHVAMRSRCKKVKKGAKHGSFQDFETLCCLIASILHNCKDLHNCKEELEARNGWDTTLRCH